MDEVGSEVVSWSDVKSSSSAGTLCVTSRSFKCTSLKIPLSPPMSVSSSLSQQLSSIHLTSACIMLKKDYSVLLIQLDGNLASDVSTRCSGRPLRTTRASGRNVGS